jgi:hypothetical protein
MTPFSVKRRPVSRDLDFLGRGKLVWLPASAAIVTTPDMRFAHRARDFTYWNDEAELRYLPHCLHCPLSAPLYRRSVGDCEIYLCNLS